MSDPRQAYEQSEALRPDAPASSEGGASARRTADQASPTAPGKSTEPNSTTEANTGANVPNTDQPTDADAGSPEGEVPVTEPLTAPLEAEGATQAPEAEEPGDPVELARALAEAERQRDEYLDHLRRERAEFDNFRKRNARERLEAMDRGVQSLVTELLGVLDNFGHVLRAAEDSPDEALAKGAQMVHEELHGVLERFGLEDVPGEGAPFDPQWHEAMMQVPAGEDVTEPTVAEVLRAGYRFKGRVLRPASVSVAQ